MQAVFNEHGDLAFGERMPDAQRNTIIATYEGVGPRRGAYRPLSGFLRRSDALQLIASGFARTTSDLVAMEFDGPHFSTYAIYDHTGARLNQSLQRISSADKYCAMAPATEITSVDQARLRQRCMGSSPRLTGSGL